MAREVFFEFSDGKILATPENTGVAMFRDFPEADYLDVWTLSNEGEQIHHWMFGVRERLIWMGRVCVQSGDERILHLSEREHGSFRAQTGWNPPVCVEDRPRDWEADLYAEWQAGRIDDDLEHLNDDDELEHLND